MAHKKAGGSASNLKDSQSQRLGVKLFGGETAHPGSIIIRQRGTKFHPGRNVMLGKDYTIFSTTDGKVEFQSKKRKRFDGSLKSVKYVHVLPAGTPSTMKPKKAAAK